MRAPSNFPIDRVCSPHDHLIIAHHHDCMTIHFDLPFISLHPSAFRACLVQVAGSEEIQRSCSFGTMQLVSGWWFLEWVKQLVMSTETSLVKDHHDEALHEPILKHRLMKRIQIPSGKLT